MIDEKAPADVLQHVTKLATEAGLDDDEDVTTAEFDYVFGGDVNVVETLEDLKSISTVEDFHVPTGQIIQMTFDQMEANGIDTKDLRNANITETAASFDSAEWVADNKWVVLFLATNNAGGESFYIPKDIVDQCPNIQKSIDMTTVMWSQPEDDKES
jgi:hypothetical protein